MKLKLLGIQNNKTLNYELDACNNLKTKELPMTTINSLSKIYNKQEQHPVPEFISLTRSTTGDMRKFNLKFKVVIILSRITKVYKKVKVAMTEKIHQFHKLLKAVTNDQYQNLLHHVFISPPFKTLQPYQASLIISILLL